MSNFKREIRLYDAVMLVSGSMIGSGIFIVSSDVARQTGASGWTLVSWLIAGLFTMAGALCYGELSAMFPQAGGQYVFLQKAYNRLVGFLYGWSFFAVIQTGTIAAISVAFSTYTGVVLPEIINDNTIGNLKIGTFYISSQRLLAILSVILLTYSNTKGIKQGKIIQNIFSSTKLIALGLIILIGFAFFNFDLFSANFTNAFDTNPTQFTKSGDSWVGGSISVFGIILALGVTQVGTLFASDAWNTLTFTGDEVVEPQKTIPRGLAIGTLVVTILFILTNIVYLGILPLKGDPNASDAIGRGIQFASQDRVAAAAAEVIGGPPFAIIVAILIMISTFGCNNGLILSGARVYYTMAEDGLFFKNFGALNDKGVPQNALWWQCLWACVLCLSGKYGDLLDYLMGVVIMFYALTIFGIFILRRTMPEAPRPVKAPLYPIVPALYVILTIAIVLILIKEKPEYTFPGLIVVAIGIPVYYFFDKK